MSNLTTCSVDGCGRPAGANGMCRGHNQRVYRTGTPGPAEFRRRGGSPAPSCKHPGCDRPREARGWCAVHYGRWRENRDMDAPIQPHPKRASPPCKIDGCADTATGKGWCNRHYQRWWRTGDPGPADLPRYGQLEFCSAEGCEREHRTKGYCDMHYRRFARGVRVDSLKFLAQPKSANPNSYGAVHMKLAAKRGRAKDQICPCGEPANGWAYQHNDPEALMSPAGHPYSTKIFDCYVAMCRSCHGLLDWDLDERLGRTQ